MVESSRSENEGPLADSAVAVVANTSTEEPAISATSANLDANQGAIGNQNDENILREIDIKSSGNEGSLQGSGKANSSDKAVSTGDVHGTALKLKKGKNKTKKKRAAPRVRVTRAHNNPEFLKQFLPKGSELHEWREDPTPGSTWDTGDYVSCFLNELSSEKDTQDPESDITADPKVIKKLLTQWCERQCRGPLWLDPTSDSYEYNEFRNIKVRFGNMIDECSFAEHFSIIVNEAIFNHTEDRLDLYITRDNNALANKISIRYRQIQRAAIEITMEDTRALIPQFVTKIALTTFGVPLLFEASKGYHDQVEKATNDGMQVEHADAEMQRAVQLQIASTGGGVRIFFAKDFGRCRTVIIEASDKPEHAKKSTSLNTEGTYRLAMELNRRLRRANADVYFCRINNITNVGSREQIAIKEQLWSGLCALVAHDFDLLYLLYTLKSSDLFLDQLLVNRNEMMEMENLLRKALMSERIAELTEGVKTALKTLEVTQTSLVRCIHACVERTKGAPTKVRCYSIREVILTPSYDEFLPPEMRPRSSIPHERLQAGHLLEVTLRDDDRRVLSSQLLCHDAADFFLKGFAKDRIKRGIMIGEWIFHIIGWTEQQIRRHSLWAYSTDQFGMQARDFQNSYLQRKKGPPFFAMSKAMKRLSNLNKICQFIRGDSITIIQEPLGAHQGQISPDLLRDLCSQLKDCQDVLPSVVHIAIGARKIILVLNPTLQGKCIQVRNETLQVLKSKHRIILLGYSQPYTCYLNRQIIAILEERGVPIGIFLQWQMEAAVASMRSFLDSNEAIATLRDRCVFDFPFTMLDKVKAKLYEDPFINRVLQDSLRSTLLRLQYKTFLSVDPKDGRKMLGIVDEFGVLKKGQVYVRYSSLHNREGPANLVLGPVLVTKTPALEPGDVRVFDAVNSRELESMNLRDVIVFSRYADGARDWTLPGGYPLEERIFVVLWRHDLTDALEDSEAELRTNAEPPVARGKMIEVEDEADLFCTFIANPAVGILCNHHLAKSDRRWRPSTVDSNNDIVDEPESEQTSNEIADECAVLAAKIRAGLRFWDKGETIKVEKKDKAPDFPHFMRKDFRDTYHSPRVLSKLYDAVTPLVRLLDLATKQCRYGTENGALFEVPGWERFRDEAEALKDSFDRKMRLLLRALGLRSESELFLRTQGELSDDFLDWANTGFFGEAHRERENKAWKMRDEIFTSVRKLFQKRLELFPGGKLAELQFISACFMVTREKCNRNELVSFPWIHAEFLESYFNDPQNDLSVATTNSPLLQFYPHLSEEFHSEKIFLSIEYLLNSYGTPYSDLLNCRAQPSCLEAALPAMANDFNGPEGGGWLRAVREYLEECCLAGQLQFHGVCLENNKACDLLANEQAMRWLSARTLMRIALTADLSCLGQQRNRWRHLLGFISQTIIVPLHPALKEKVTGANQKNLEDIAARLQKRYDLKKLKADVLYRNRASPSLRFKATGILEKIELLEESVRKPKFQLDLANEC